jgi:signal recognition particle subunit SRP19
VTDSARTEHPRAIPALSSFPNSTNSTTHIAIPTMSRNAQVEEMSDSDPEEVAPVDSTPLTGNTIIAPASVPASSTAPRPMPQAQMPQAPMPEPQREIPKHFQCIYPVYFDKTRSRSEGRKVGSELAVENPLARDIVDAVQMLGLKAGLEPEKLHPKDWANPGRVRVQLKDEDGRLLNSKIKNSKSSRGFSN